MAGYNSNKLQKILTRENKVIIKSIMLKWHLTIIPSQLVLFVNFEYFDFVGLQT